MPTRVNLARQLVHACAGLNAGVDGSLNTTVTLAGVATDRNPDPNAPRSTRAETVCASIAC
jgi:hypothetical protein